MPIIPGTVTVASDGSESSAAGSSTAKIIYDGFVLPANYVADNTVDGPHGIKLTPEPLQPNANVPMRKALAVLANRIGAVVAAPSRTPVAAGDYTVLVSDVLIAKTGIDGINDDVTIPDNATLRDGRIITVKDESGTAAPGKTITIIATGKTIDGAANYVISSPYYWAQLYSDSNNWFVIG